MASLSNLPPGCESGGYRSQPQEPQKCKNGHEWKADLYYELGAFFYVNDEDAFCPTCNEEAEEPK